MTTTNDLKGTIERLRAEKFPNLPADLVAKILTIEAEFPDNRAEAYKRCVEAVDDYLRNEGTLPC
jgi:hypothetical protein